MCGVSCLKFHVGDPNIAGVFSIIGASLSEPHTSVTLNECIQIFHDDGMSTPMYVYFSKQLSKSQTVAVKESESEDNLTL